MVAAVVGRRPRAREVDDAKALPEAGAPAAPGARPRGGARVPSGDGSRARQPGPAGERVDPQGRVARPLAFHGRREPLARPRAGGARTPAQPGLHRQRSRLPGPRDRRQHDPLLARRRADAERAVRARRPVARLRPPGRGQPHGLRHAAAAPRQRRLRGGRGRARGVVRDLERRHRDEAPVLRPGHEELLRRPGRACRPRAGMDRGGPGAGGRAEPSAVAPALRRRSRGGRADDPPGRPGLHGARGAARDAPVPVGLRPVARDLRPASQPRGPRRLRAARTGPDAPRRACGGSGCRPPARRLAAPRTRAPGGRGQRDHGRRPRATREPQHRIAGRVLRFPARPRRPGAAHRLHQRGGPPARPGLDAAAGDRGARGPRREPRAPPPAAAHREPAAGGGRRRPRLRPRAGHRPRPGGPAAAGAGCRSSCTSSRTHASPSTRRRSRWWRRFWPDSCPPGRRRATRSWRPSSASAGCGRAARWWSRRSRRRSSC